MGTPNDDEVLDIGQLAAMLGVEVDTIRGWRTRGQGPPACKIGQRMLRWRRSAVLGWLDEHRETREAG